LEEMPPHLKAEANNIIYWEKPRQHQDSKEDSNGNSN